MDRKAAAEARRAKVLARGGDRLAKITGSVQEPDAGPPPQPVTAAAPAQHAAPAPAPPATTAAAPPRASPAVAAPTASTGSASTLTAELGGAVRSRSKLPAPLPQMQQAARGTATNGKWAAYSAPSAAPRPKRALRRVSAAETLGAAVVATSRPRLLLAAQLAVLLAMRWDAAALAYASGTCKAAAGQACASTLAPPAAPAGPSGEPDSGWLGWLERGKAAMAALRQPAMGQHVPPPSAQPQLPAALAKKLRALLDAAAASTAGQQASTTMQALRARLDAAAASPAGRQVAAATQSLRAHAAALAATPAGRQAAAATQALRALLAAAAASPVAQRLQAAWGRLPPASSLLQQLRSHAAAVAAAPAVQQALDAVERLPPLASLSLLSLSLVGAAAAGLAAAPSLVHSTLELDLQTPSLLMRLAGAVPGLARQLALLAAWQRLLTSLLDDAAAFVVALLAYHQLPQLSAAAHAWLHG